MCFAMSDIQRSKDPESRLAFEVVETTGCNLFLTGRAGTGKTTFLKELKSRAMKRMVVLAPTGIAAIQAGGSTVHSFFQLPFGLYLPGYRRTNKFRIGSEKIELMRNLDLLVIDEASMLRADILDEISGVLQRYRGNTDAFGGVQLLLIGDLQQLPPIVKEEEWAEMKAYYPSPYFFDSRELRRAGFFTLELKTVYRQSDPVFIRLLEKIRKQELDQASIDLLSSRFRPGFSPSPTDGYVTLTTHNWQSNAINQERLAALPGREVSYQAEITGDFPETSFPTWRQLRFKPGAQVMFVKNDSSPEKRYYNGKIGVLKACLPQKVVVDSQGEEIEVGIEEWENVRYRIDERTREIKEEIEGVFCQIPLRLAWAITIHKSQGLTFDKVVVDAGKAFAHGQVYVALSRCRSLEGLVLRSPLAKEALVPDPLLEDFCRDGQCRIVEEDLPRFQAGYVSDMIAKQFDFSLLWQLLDSLLDFSSKVFASLYRRLQEDVCQVHACFDSEVLQVSARFGKELRALQSAPKERLDERCCKAAVYFSGKLDEWVRPLLPRLGVEIDNRLQEKNLSRLRKRLSAEYAEKQATLRAVVEGRGFDLYRFLQARTSSFAGMEAAGNPGGSPDSKRLKGSKESKDMPVPEYSAGTGSPSGSKQLSGRRHPSVPVPVSRPACASDPELPETALSESLLARRLKAWRLQQARQEGKPAFCVLTQKSLLGIAARWPASEAELLAVKGVGPATVARYGAGILDIVAECKAEHAAGSAEPAKLAEPAGLSGPDDVGVTVPALADR